MKRMLVRIVIILIALSVLVGISVLTAVCVCAGRKHESQPADCIVVLGAHVWMDGRMSNALTYRCEAALQAWRNGLADTIIVCGAQGSNEPETEAAAMLRWMIAQGVPENRVIPEDKSVNTRQNLENALAIMGARGMKTAIVCTNDYHLTRALWLARDVGLPASGLPAQSTRDIVSFVRGRLRETCSWMLYFARKHLFSGMR